MERNTFNNNPPPKQMKGKIVACMILLESNTEIPEGTQIMFDEPLEFDSAYLFGKMDDNRYLTSPFPELNINHPINFNMQDSEQENRAWEEIQEAIERKSRKVNSRPITDEELELMNDFISYHTFGKKGEYIGVKREDYTIFDISENIKKVILSEMYLSPDRQFSNIAISQYCINEGVVFYENNFVASNPSGELNINDIMSGLQQ